MDCVRIVWQPFGRHTVPFVQGIRIAASKPTMWYCVPHLATPPLPAEALRKSLQRDVVEGKTRSRAGFVVPSSSVPAALQSNNKDATIAFLDTDGFLVWAAAVLKLQTEAFLRNAPCLNPLCEPFSLDGRVATSSIGRNSPLKVLVVPETGARERVADTCRPKTGRDGLLPPTDSDGYFSATQAVAVAQTLTLNSSSWYVVRDIAHGVLVLASDDRYPGRPTKGFSLSFHVDGFAVMFWDPDTKQRCQFPEIMFQRMYAWLHERGLTHFGGGAASFIIQSTVTQVVPVLVAMIEFLNTVHQCTRAFRGKTDGSEPWMGKPGQQWHQNGGTSGEVIAMTVVDPLGHDHTDGVIHHAACRKWLISADPNSRCEPCDATHATVAKRRQRALEAGQQHVELKLPNGATITVPSKVTLVKVRQDTLNDVRAHRTCNTMHTIDFTDFTTVCLSTDGEVTTCNLHTYGAREGRQRSCGCSSQESRK
jgi:hypothetical protein